MKYFYNSLYQETCLEKGTRTNIKTRSAVLSLCMTLILLTSHTIVNAQRLSREYHVDILVNQAGYLPEASKTCVAPGSLNREFKVIHIESNKIVHTGDFSPAPTDLGIYSTGDFSDLRKEGMYYILSDTLRSYPFKISNNVYDQGLSSIIDYFSKQRCGGSTTGYLTPCHLDDGVRMDNGKHHDVSGGWHDASDLRKWVGATIYGMIGLAKGCELYPALDKKRLLDELKWGNRYFLSMQEPQGYIMSYVGGDVLKHSDSNRWTDNETGDYEEGEARFVIPNSGISRREMLIIGTKDDRVIKTDPSDFLTQYNFVTSEAIVARIAKDEDPDYSAKCLEAAKKCFNWATTNDDTDNPGVLGASIQAALELYKTSNNASYKDFAIKAASNLKELQASNEKNKISGFYYTSSETTEPYKNISRGCMEFYAVSDLIKHFPDHSDVPSWKTMVRQYARNYLQTFIERNSFGIVPFGLYTKEDPGGNRKMGEYWYRYFMQPELSWWVGINANLAAAGVGLVKAAQVLDDPELVAFAQHQLDWIIGVNPFNSSTLIGTGYNHPKHFPGSTFYPQTPVIIGAVMNGLGGNHEDQTVIANGIWQISEYWTPMVAYTFWLMAELSASQ
jgi:hypothetical protein